MCGTVGAMVTMARSRLVGRETGTADKAKGGWPDGRRGAIAGAEGQVVLLVFHQGVGIDVPDVGLQKLGPALAEPEACRAGRADRRPDLGHHIAPRFGKERCGVDPVNETVQGFSTGHPATPHQRPTHIQINTYEKLNQRVVRRPTGVRLLGLACGAWPRTAGRASWANNKSRWRAGHATG